MSLFLDGKDNLWRILLSFTLLKNIILSGFMLQALYQILLYSSKQSVDTGTGILI